MPYRIALLANLKKNAPHWPGRSKDAWDDLDSEETIDSILAALRSGGHEAYFLEGDVSLAPKLQAQRPDLCFNLCEGHFGDAREAQVPALLEMLRIPYTGSQVLCLALCLDKPMTKRILAFHDLPTPAFQVFERIDEPLSPDLAYPLFVKPSREGTGMGVSARSIVHAEPDLREQIATVIERYDQPALVETFIQGREVTVGVLGNLRTPVARRVPEDEYAPRVLGGLRFLPPLEVDFTRYPPEEAGVYTNRIKTELADDFYLQCPADLPPQLVQELDYLTAAVFRVTVCQDVARVDFRLDANDNDKPYILEVNPLPGLNPRISDLALEAAAAGMSHADLINTIVDLAAARYGLQTE